jgi:hypothetical protein
MQQLEAAMMGGGFDALMATGWVMAALEEFTLLHVAH